MTETPLDRAHAAMQADPEDDAARLRFHERLADAELFLMLRAEPEGDRLDPETVEVEGTPFVLAFDLEERLSAFAEGAVPYAGLSGRALAAMLAGQGVGLALNPDVAPSAHLAGPQAIDWLAETLGQGPAEVEARIEELTRPEALPEALLQALDAKLSTTAGRARLAYLAGAIYDTGARGHLLAFVDAAEGTAPALARAVNEALTFSGLEAGALDVAFFAASDAISGRLARVGLRFDLPQPEPGLTVTMPGSDPEAPPRLR